VRLYQCSLAEWPHQSPGGKLSIDHRRSAQCNANAINRGGQRCCEMGKAKPAWPNVIGATEPCQPIIPPQLGGLFCFRLAFDECLRRKVDVVARALAEQRGRAYGKDGLSQKRHFHL